MYNILTYIDSKVSGNRDSLSDINHMTNSQEPSEKMWTRTTTTLVKDDIEDTRILATTTHTVNDTSPRFHTPV